MWRSPVVVTPPEVEPIDLESAKAHLKVDDTVEDELIALHIAAARGHVESLTGTRMVTQELVLTADTWEDLGHLPIGPVSEVLTITYRDSAGADAALAADAYEVRLHGLESAIVLRSGRAWPAREAGSLITVSVVAGYGEAGVQPAEVMAALKLLIGDFYAHRETVQVGSVAGRIPAVASVEALLANHKIHLV
ncbi:MAG: hypothetical protein EON91_02680 [Brevundimonas sp.]|uniref:head-tail connector protein n=1 Tax=Brevundimonas sp. TaxID=1871086 RepID=UPI0011FE6F57|nr:phage head-tail connector protein [Brevundimonas sp.]RZJ19119.1 MAG: hypothetical protein EON91_02680 [Brevundimonas sp.]